MSKLRKVQFFRNSGNLTAYASHDAAVTAAKAAWTGQGFANMEDGELLLYRYTISGETGTPAHTIVGVVRNNNGTKDFEVLANYDMLTSQDVTGYKQAYVTSDTNGSSFTVQGIQENNGLIGVDSAQSVTINIEGEYNDSSNKIATQSTVSTAVTNAVEALNGSAAIASESNGVVTLKAGVQEVQGIISNNASADITLAKVATSAQGVDVAYDNTTSGLVATNVKAAIDEVQGNVHTVQGNLETVAASIKDGKIQHNSTDVFSANTATNLTLKQYDFVYNNGVLGVNVQTETAADNKIATMLDIANLSGAMHYKGEIDDNTEWPASPAAGDTYVVPSSATSWTHGSQTIEPGDMIVFGESGAFTVVNMNITLGTGAGQVAANQTALTATEIVVAGSNGVQTTGYTFDAESAANTTTIGPSSSNAQVPTSKNVYDAIQGLAVNSVSETVGVTNNSGSDSATITDTLTVDGTAAAQSVTIAGGDGVNVTGDASTQTITVAVDLAANTSTTAVNDGSNLLLLQDGELTISNTWDCGTYGD